MYTTYLWLFQQTINQDTARAWLEGLLSAPGAGLLLWTIMAGLTHAIKPLDNSTAAKFWTAAILGFIIPPGAYLALVSFGWRVWDPWQLFNYAAVGYGVSQFAHGASQFIVAATITKKVEAVVGPRVDVPAWHGAVATSKAVGTSPQDFVALKSTPAGARFVEDTAPEDFYVHLSLTPSDNAQPLATDESRTPPDEEWVDPVLVRQIHGFKSERKALGDKTDDRGTHFHCEIFTDYAIYPYPVAKLWQEDQAGNQVGNKLLMRMPTPPGETEPVRLDDMSLMIAGHDVHIHMEGHGATGSDNLRSQYSFAHVALNWYNPGGAPGEHEGAFTSIPIGSGGGGGGGGVTAEEVQRMLDDQKGQILTQIEYWGRTAIGNIMPKVLAIFEQIYDKEHYPADGVHNVQPWDAVLVAARQYHWSVLDQRAYYAISTYMGGHDPAKQPSLSAFKASSSVGATVGEDVTPMTIEQLNQAMIGMQDIMEADTLFQWDSGFSLPTHDTTAHVEGTEGQPGVDSTGKILYTPPVPSGEPAVPTDGCGEMGAV